MYTHTSEKKEIRMERIVELSKNLPYKHRLLQHLLMKGVNKNVAFNQN